MQPESVVITGSARTPVGDLLGCLNQFKAPELGAIAIKGALKRSGLDSLQVDEVLMGCVLSAGQGQAPARQAALAAGMPTSIGCTTINKMCGSGMKAIMLAHDLIKAGSAKIVVAGGMESMSHAPYLLSNMRSGQRIGHDKVIDHMLMDGLEDAQGKRLMGCYAEDCAEKYSFSRAQQDAFAVQSLARAQTAMKNGRFNDEIEPVIFNAENNTPSIDQDEHPRLHDVSKISQLKPVFKTDGTVTAANSSSISDGAAAVVLMSEAEAKKRQITPLAKIIAHQSYAQDSALFTTAPIFAIEKLLHKLEMQTKDIDLFEINEAFAVVVMAAMKELQLDDDKVNVHGGACALGHPIGASGARIVVTLLSAMQQYGLKRGLASLCIGGGEATAMLIER
jgi:acetyl-CoA C-acetyltransferase